MRDLQCDSSPNESSIEILDSIKSFDLDVPNANDFVQSLGCHASIISPSDPDDDNGKDRQTEEFFIDPDLNQLNTLLAVIFPTDSRYFDKEGEYVHNAAKDSDKDLSVIVHDVPEWKNVLHTTSLRK